MPSNNICIHENCDLSFSDFEFVRGLSHGSYGITSVRKHKDGKLFCFKSIPSPSSGYSVEELFLFKDLRSPFLVQLHHAFRVEARSELCMEYCSGGSLADLIKTPYNLTNDDILFILVQLAHGLADLHSRSMVHRDIKPENIVLMSKTPPFRVKYCDYGESKHLEDTVARTVRGTYRFMAPEIVAKHISGDTEKIPYTPAVDVWSLGIVLYLLVEKRYPFDGLWITNDDVIPRSNSEFGDLIEKMLVKDASKRITVEELINHPQIKELYDFIENFDENLFSKYHIWIMRKEMQKQSNLIERLQSDLEAANVKVSTQNSLIEDQSTIIRNLKSQLSNKSNVLNSTVTSEISALNATVDNQNAKISTQNFINQEQSNLIKNLQSKNSQLEAIVSSLQLNLNQVYSLSSDQSILIDQFKTLLPFISHIKAFGISQEEREKQRLILERKRVEEERQRKLAEERRIAELKRQEEREKQRLALERKRIEEEKQRKLAEERRIAGLKRQEEERRIEAQLNEKFMNSGGLKFLACNRGNKIALSQSHLIATRTSYSWSWDNSFIAIQHPVKGKVVLTLLNFKDDFATFAGFFYPSDLSAGDCYRNSQALYVNNRLTQFYVNHPNTAGPSVQRGISIGQQVLIEFNLEEAVFSVPSLDYSIRITWPSDYVFGLVCGHPKTSWELSLI
ncbi:hypothetical protein RCL1_007861 [Eukaryota sp. TZLM3-RCL]